MFRHVAALLIAASFCAHGAELAVGSPAPTLEAKLLQSDEVMKVSGQQGLVTIVNLWATWCTPCLAEMPALQSYYDRHKAQGIRVLAISMDGPEAQPEVLNIAKNYTFPIALKSGASLKGWGRIWRMPTTFVIDKQGVLRRNGHVGTPEVTLESLEAEVTPLLRQ